MKKLQQRQRSRRLQGMDPSPINTTRSPDPPADNEHPTVQSPPISYNNPPSMTSETSSQLLSVSESSPPSINSHPSSSSTSTSVRQNLATTNNFQHSSSSSSTLSSDPPADPPIATPTVQHTPTEYNTPTTESTNPFNLRNLSTARLRNPINHLTTQLNQLVNPKRSNNNATPATDTSLQPSQTIPPHRGTTSNNPTHDQHVSLSPEDHPTDPSVIDEHLNQMSISHTTTTTPRRQPIDPPEEFHIPPPRPSPRRPTPNIQTTIEQSPPSSLPSPSSIQAGIPIVPYATALDPNDQHKPNEFTAPYYEPSPSSSPYEQSPSPLIIDTPSVPSSSSTSTSSHYLPPDPTSTPTFATTSAAAAPYTSARTTSVHAPPVPTAPGATPTTSIIIPKDTKLSFQTYNPTKQPYLVWKRLCMATASLNQLYGPDIVIKRGLALAFNPHMSDDSSRALYLATTTALYNSPSSYLITTSQALSADGYKLWETLDMNELGGTTSMSRNQKLGRKFNNMTKQQSESMDSYTTRFIQLHDELAFKGVTINSGIELVCQYLTSLQMPEVFKDHIRDLAKERWHLGLSLIDIGLWCKNEIEEYNAFVPPHQRISIDGTRSNSTSNSNNNANSSANSSTNNNTQPPSNQSSSNPPRVTFVSPPVPPQPQYTPAPPSRQQFAPPAPEPFPSASRPRRPVNEALLSDLRQQVCQSTNPEQYFRDLHHSNPSFCPIHNLNHSLLMCTSLYKMCEQCGVHSNLMEIRREVGLLPPRQNTAPAARYSNSNRNQPPSSAPPSTPYPPQPPRPPAPSPSRPAPSTAPPTAVANPYRRATQPPSALRNSGASQTARRIQVQQTPTYEHEVIDYYSGEGGQHSVIEVNDTHINTNNNDNYAYSPLANNTCRSVTFANQSKTSDAHRVIASTTTNTKHHNITRVLKTIFRIVYDSAATHHMCPFFELFENITYYNMHSPDAPMVAMGDEKTLVPVVGHGYINVLIHGKRLRLHALFVPNMGETILYSIRQHMNYKGCSFIAQNEDTMITYPSFIIHPRVSTEIEVLIQNATISDLPISFDEETAEESLPSSNTSFITDRHITLNMISQSQANTVSRSHHHKLSRHTVKIKKLVPHAHLPQRSTSGSIGYDVKPLSSITLAPHSQHLVPLGLSTQLPQDMYLRIADRSSLALKGITVQGGVVDSDYRGEIKVMLRNLSNTTITIPNTQHVAQFIFETATTPLIQLCDFLDDTDRGKGGFGSTDSKSCSRTQTFRLSDEEILITTKRNSSRPTVRRAPLRNIHAPIIDPNDHPPDDPEMQQVNHHPLNPHENQPLDPILKMKMAPTDVSLPNQPESHSTAQAAPTVLPVDRVNSSLPKTVSITQDVLRKSVGFLDTKVLLRNLKDIGTDTIHVPDFSENPTIDPGMTASMKSKRRNTTPSDIPPNYSDCWHLDIGFGPCTGIGGVRYCLMAVDKSTRFKFCYGLKNLTSSLHEAIRSFLIDCGKKPTLIRTDFDTKLIGGETQKILTDAGIRIEAAPPRRQHQNGLVERAWQTIVSMARNWMTSARLPAKYWYFAVKRACEVMNILPIKRFDQITTPFEAVYDKKVDYRVLFPLFSVAYIKQDTANEGEGRKWKDRSLKCIVVGTCPISDALLFYHPPSKQLLSCAENYRFDTFSPSGPQFNEPYESNFIFNTKSSMENYHQPLAHEQGTEKYFKADKDGQYIKVRILSIPIDDTKDNYIIQEIDTGNIHEVEPEQLRDDDPTTTPIDIPNPSLPLPHIPWVKDNAKVTMLLPHMPTPKQGFLQFSDTKWHFIPGRTKKNPPVELANFEELAESMIENKKMFKGWTRHKIVETARRVRITSNLLAANIINRKVSAANLHLLQAPTLLKHHLLHPEDKAIWDEAYRQEWQGLKDIDTWETISEEEYNNTKHLYRGTMPTMAISVIKRDENGNPVRAKYRIVALGNLDPNTWSKSDCFAPVLSQIELRLLTAIAAQRKCIPKTADVAQAFCQSYLPEGENYICRPPAGCPQSLPNTYWKLRKTLYGLKRSPRHFYELAKKTLLSIGFTVHPTSPCIFIGNLIPNEPPIYLGIYVDDMIYFSESRQVEEKFEKDFGAKLNTDFNGPIQWFLGIKFQHQRHTNGDVTIHLSQEAFIDTLADLSNLNKPHMTNPKTPYRSGYPVDSIPTVPNNTNSQITHKMQQLIGSLNWLSISTRPDIATITNMLAKYTLKATPAHIDAVKRVIKYLKGTKEYGITFSTTTNHNLESFVKFPIPPNQVTSLTDANWGPQDQSKPLPNETRTLDLFKSRSLSGFLVWLGGPIHWSSKRQTITARSSAEAEIYATDECVKFLQYISFLLEGMHLKNEFMPEPNNVYNDNSASIHWAHNMTTKGLRHLQIRENAIRESVQNGFVNIKHIDGKINLADLFTKEDKDGEHFIALRDLLVCVSIPFKFPTDAPFSKGGVELGVEKGFSAK